MQTMDALIEKIKSFEWCWHIKCSIGGRDCWSKLYREIGKVIKITEISRRINYTMIFGENVYLLRVPSFFEFNAEGTGFELFYKDSHTDAKWYIKHKA